MRKRRELQTVSQILAGDHHDQVVYEMYGHLLDKADQHGIENLADAERAVICTVLLEAEVNNGGFDQYFFNSSGNWAKYTLAALASVGAWHTAALFRKALAVFPDGQPSDDRAIRWQQMDRIADSQIFSELDQAFYKEEDDLTELLYKYITTNRSEFERAG